MRLKNPAAGVLSAAKRPGGDEIDMEMPPITDQATKKLKSPTQAHKQQVAQMEYRKRTPAPTMDGGRMRAKDIGLGSRKRGAY